MTSAKSGCCYHESTVYDVVNDNLIPFSRAINDSATDIHYEYYYEEKWANGRNGKRVKTERSRQEGYCENEFEDAARSLGHYHGSESRVCNLLPYASKQGIVALHYPSNGKDSEASAKGIDVFLVSLSSGDILGFYSEPNEFKSDHLEQLQVDTAAYLVRPNLRAFGVRSSFRLKQRAATSRTTP